MGNNFNIDREEYISHIHDIEEIADMRRILDKIEIVLRSYGIESTDFLSPYTRKLAKSILNRFIEISYSEIGGLEDAERQSILIYPEYHYLTKEDYPVSAIRLKGDMEGLSHRDFLGAVLNIGITRDKIGDILVHDYYADIMVKTEIKNFILINIDKIGNNNFKASEISFHELEEVEDEFREINQTLSSSRLDVYLSAAYNFSRKVSQGLIESGKVKVNWEPVDKTFIEVQEGDMVSVRGYGRSKLYSIDGLSRKDRLKVRIRILL